jgi:hypothetical protein
MRGHNSKVTKTRKYEEYKDKRLQAAKVAVKIKSDKPLSDKSILKFVQETEGKKFKDV